MAPIRSIRRIRGRPWGLHVIPCLVVVACAQLQGPNERSVLRVGTSGDYPPFTRAQGALDAVTGFDPAVARAWAAERGSEIEWVRFRWTELLGDLAAQRFDVAMSGVTIRPERALAGRFSVPVVRSGAVVLVRDPAAFPSLAALSRPGVRIAVNAGGHLERVTRAHFPRALVLPQSENVRVPEVLRDGLADAAVTDTLEAPHWMAAHPGLVPYGPFTRDTKAYLWHPRHAALAAELDRWLLEREAEGTLGALRREWLGAGADAPVARPLPALLATVRERLSLMPFVADAKRRSGAPVEDRAREAVVLDAAVSAALQAARELRRPPPDTEAVRRFYRAQIEAAKQIQRRVLAEAPDPARRAADLRSEIRPALLRIGDRIAALLVRLPGSESCGGVARKTRRALESEALAEPALTAIASALETLCTSPPPGVSLDRMPAAAASTPATLLSSPGPGPGLIESLSRTWIDSDAGDAP